MKILINNGYLKGSLFYSMRGKLLESIISNGHSIILTGELDNCNNLEGINGISLVSSPVSRAGMNPLLDLKLLLFYIRFIRKNHIDIVHSYTAKANIYGSIGAKIAGVKRIFPTINGLGYAFTKQSSKARLIKTILCILYKIAFKCSTKVFFQNRDDINELVKLGVIERDRCVLISGSGVDLEKYSYSESTGEPVFFLASRLLVSKGVKDYFDAARVVKKQYPKARFVLAGALDDNPDSIDKNELNDLVNQGIVEYLGVIDDMPDALKKCSIFVLPSYYREGIPHSLLEALSVGRAIITTNSPGCKETVNERNGFLIEPHSPDQLIKKMTWMIEHPREVEKMGSESRKYAEDRFDVNIVNSTIMETMGIMSNII